MPMRMWMCLVRWSHPENQCFVVNMAWFGLLWMHTRRHLCVPSCMCLGLQSDRSSCSVFSNYWQPHTWTKVLDGCLTTLWLNYLALWGKISPKKADWRKKKKYFHLYVCDVLPATLQLFSCVFVAGPDAKWEDPRCLVQVAENTYQKKHQRSTSSLCCWICFVAWTGCWPHVTCTKHSSLCFSFSCRILSWAATCWRWSEDNRDCLNYGDELNILWVSVPRAEQHNFKRKHKPCRQQFQCEFWNSVVPSTGFQHNSKNRTVWMSHFNTYWVNF